MLTKQEIEFITLNLNCDVNTLSLKKNKYKDINISLCINQISARQKTKHKLPIFNQNMELIYPINISVEQASSEKCAEYKANLINYRTSIDLTGGMGIDSIYIAKKSNHHIYVEQNAELCKIFEHNCKALKIDNVTIVNKNSIEYLNNSDHYFDLIYLDPARRSYSGAKTYFLDDTEPDPIQVLKLIKHKYAHLMLKTSPLLDISQAERQLGKLSQVHIVSIDNECKELILIKANTDTILIADSISTKYYAVNIIGDNIIKTMFDNQDNHINEYSNPIKYLYESNASIMKLGLWNETANKFNLKRIAANSHLYTSDKLVPDFPGRVFEITAIEKLDKNLILKHVPKNKANISVRNFPLTVDEIKKKTGIKDGGDIYIFATELNNSTKVIIISKKVK